MILPLALQRKAGRHLGWRVNKDYSAKEESSQFRVMRGLGGGYGDPHPMRTVVKRPMQVRQDHQAFVQQTSEEISYALAESSALIREVDSSRTALGNGAYVSDLSMSRKDSPRALSPGDSGLPRSTRSARDLFAALTASDGLLPAPLPPPAVRGTDGHAKAVAGPRSISVREFQCGTPVVAPAPPLPFPGPDSLSPGERRRVQAVATAMSIGRPDHQGVAASRTGEPPKLADGQTTMLHGVHTDLGELSLTPCAPSSSFESLLDKLVDAPDMCFARPLAISAPPNPLGDFNRRPG